MYVHRLIRRQPMRQLQALIHILNHDEIWTF